MQFSKRLLVLLALFTSLSIGLCSAIRLPATGQDAASAQSKLQALLEQRRDVLKSKAESARKMFQNNRCEFSEVVSADDANVTTVNASLDWQ